MAHTVKNLPARPETLVPSLGWEDALEKEMATHSSILAWRIPCTEEPGGIQSLGSQRVGHDWAANTLNLCHILDSACNQYYMVFVFCLTYFTWYNHHLQMALFLYFYGYVMFHFWRRQWHPTPVLSPGKPHVWGSLLGCCLWGHTESDKTEVTE